MNKTTRTKIFWRSIVLFITCALGTLPTAGLFAQPDQEQLSDEAQLQMNEQIYQESASDNAETKLLKERIRAVLEEVELKRQRVSDGQEQVFFLLDTQKRLIEAQLDYHKKPAVIIALLEANVALARQTELERKLRIDSGVGRPDDYAQAKFRRADAELRLLRARKKYNPANNGDQPRPIQQENEEMSTLGGKSSSDSGLEAPVDVDNQLPAANAIEKWKNGIFTDKAYKISGGDDQETRLKKQRINTALMELDHFKQIIGLGLETLDVSIDCQKRLVAAQLEFHTEPTEIVSVLEQALESAKVVEAIVRDQFQEGADVSIQQVAQATYYRLGCEIDLLRAKKKYRLLDAKK